MSSSGRLMSGMSMSGGGAVPYWYMASSSSSHRGSANGSGSWGSIRNPSPIRADSGSPPLPPLSACRCRLTMYSPSRNGSCSASRSICAYCMMMPAVPSRPSCWATLACCSSDCACMARFACNVATDTPALYCASAASIAIWLRNCASARSRASLESLRASASCCTPYRNSGSLHGSLAPDDATSSSSPVARLNRYRLPP